jgi:hypothetical protein
MTVNSVQCILSANIHTGKQLMHSIKLVISLISVGALHISILRFKLQLTVLANIYTEEENHCF